MKTTQAYTCLLSLLSIAIVGCRFASLTAPGHQAFGSLTDSRKFLQIIGKTAAQTIKILGKPKHDGNDGNSFRVLEYDVKGFAYFTIKVRWDHASDKGQRERPEEAFIEANTPDVSTAEDVFKFLGLDKRQWKGVGDEQIPDYHEFETDKYSLSLYSSDQHPIKNTAFVHHLTLGRKYSRK